MPQCFQRSSWCVWLILAVLPCGPLVGQQPKKRETTTDLSAATDYCKSFSFPGWHIKSDNPMFGYEDWRGYANMEIRTSSKDSEYLIALRSHLHYYKGIRYSDEKWKINWNGPKARERAGEDEWAAAAIVNPFKSPYDFPEGYNLLERAERRSISLEGHALSIEGENWAWPSFAILLSPDKRHAILQSLTGIYTPTSDRGLGDYYVGTAFVQVYSLTTGREAFRVTGTWKGHGLASIFRNTQWIDSKTLIVSFDPHYMKDVVICRLDH